MTLVEDLMILMLSDSFESPQASIHDPARLGTPCLTSNSAIDAKPL